MSARSIPRRLGWLVVVACGASPPPPKQAPRSQCGEVADHLISQMSAAAKAQPEDVDPYRKALFKHCSEDGWSKELQQCLLASHDLKDNERCNPLFTGDQNEKLGKERPH